MAMNLNKALLIGNLTRDPENRTTTSGTNVSSFSVATTRRWKDKQSGENRDQTEFHNVVAWGRLSEIAAQYLHKGSKVFVEGHIQTRSWEDQTGTKKYRTEIIAANIIMLDRPGSSPARPADAAEPAPPAAKPEEEEINVEDIPF